MEHQSYAYGKNHWALEPDLPALLERHWKDWRNHKEELERFGALAGGRPTASPTTWIKKPVRCW